jgi:hypothetical protein
MRMEFVRCGDGSSEIVRTHAVTIAVRRGLCNERDLKEKRDA